MTENTRKSDMLRKVRAMMAKADSTDNQHEADAFRGKAEALMLQYRIEEWEVHAEAEDNSPGDRLMDFAWYWSAGNRDIAGSQWLMMGDIARHCRVKIVYWRSGAKLPVVGLPSDIDYFDMLFTSLMLEMGKGLEPKPDPNKLMIENLVALKEAGQQWARIAEQLHAIGQLTDEQYNPEVLEGEYGTYSTIYQDRLKKQIHGLNFSGKYTAYCKKNNRERLRVTPKIYQRSFSLGFVNEINRRLAEMRSHARKNQPTTQGNGMDLVLASIWDRVQHKAVELYGTAPQHKSRGGKGRTVSYDQSAMNTGREAAARVDLGATKVTQGRGQLSS